MPMAAQGAPSPHRELFWEMNQQTAVRRGNWKLVLKGQLVEGVAPEDDVHLADLANDMGERHNLKDEYPNVVADLTAAAEEWRAGIEERWERHWLPLANGTTTHSSTRSG
jgi:arylsulfatase A-like enzyme